MEGLIFGILGYSGIIKWFCCSFGPIIEKRQCTFCKSLHIQVFLPGNIPCPH